MTEIKKEYFIPGKLYKLSHQIFGVKNERWALAGKKAMYSVKSFPSDEVIKSRNNLNVVQVKDSETLLFLKKVSWKYKKQHPGRPISSYKNVYVFLRCSSPTESPTFIWDVWDHKINVEDIFDRIIT